MDKILIIDDNPLNINVFVEALGHAWDLSVANSFEEAFERLDQEDICLIVLDVVIDGATAFDFVAKISEMEDCLSIPIIYLTSMEERHEMHRAMKLSGTDYIFKPLDIQEIQMTIRNQMRLIAR